MNNMEEQEQQLQKLLEENLRLNAETHEICLKIKKYMFMAQIYGVIKTLIIVIPLIIALFYLTPFVKDVIPMFKQAVPAYEELLDIKSSNPDIQSILNNSTK